MGEKVLVMNLIFFIDLRVRDAVFLLSNYSRTWDELTSVFSEVSSVVIAFI